MVGFERLGGQAVAGAHWHRGLAGYFASALDLSCAHCLSSAGAASKTTAGWCSPCALDSYHRPCCPGLRCPGLSDLFLIYTPIDTDHVRGVQGRYFVIALPVAAVFIAALVNRELPRGMPAAIAIAGSMIAGITTADEVLRIHW